MNRVVVFSSRRRRRALLEELLERHDGTAANALPPVRAAAAAATAAAAEHRPGFSALLAILAPAQGVASRRKLRPRGTFGRVLPRGHAARTEE